MSESTPWVKTLVSAIVLAGVTTSTNTSMAAAAAAAPNSEKCFGISKKGANDCASPNHACQGQSIQDNDPNEFL